MRLVYRIINLFRGKKSPKQLPMATVEKEKYARWLGI